MKRGDFNAFDARFTEHAGRLVLVVPKTYSFRLGQRVFLRLQADGLVVSPTSTGLVGGRLLSIRLSRAPGAALAKRPKASIVIKVRGASKRRVRARHIRKANRNGKSLAAADQAL